MTNFSLPGPAESTLYLTVDSAHPLFIVGRNGTGKSALMHRLRQKPELNTIYLPGSRTALFDGESLSLTPKSRRDLANNLPAWDNSAEARWKNFSGNQRNEKAIHDLTAAEHQYINDCAKTIARNSDSSETADAIAKLQSKESPLDRVNQLLEQANIPVQMLIADNELKATSGDNIFSYARMSDGERIALILIAEVIAAKPGVVFLIDEPELHLHRSIVVPLIATLIKSRLDCEFVISTHELDLPTSFAKSRVCIVRSVAWQSSGEVANAAAAANAKAAKEIERGFANSGSGWGRTFRVRVKPSRITPGDEKRIMAMPKTRKPRKALRTYKAPLIDRRGRVAVYMRVRYVGFKTKKWRAGLSADHALYILRDHALEICERLELQGVISNMGKDAAEIAACWRTLEALEEGYRANAIVQYRIVLNLPAGLTPDQRRQVVEEFSERSFGRLGLPYVAAIHKPDASGDQRNFHAHICFSTRPCERVSKDEWLISEEKVNGLTDPAGLLRLRAQSSAHLNLACHNAGLPVRYTHQSYQDRGIDAERQGHVGPAAMAAYRPDTAHPVFADFSARLPAELQGEFVSLIGLLGSSVPVAALHSDFAGSPEEVRADEVDVQALRQMAEAMIPRLIELGTESDRIPEILRQVDPFNSAWLAAKPIIEEIIVREISDV